jgi:hypothetical protein
MLGITVTRSALQLNCLWPSRGTSFKRATQTLLELGYQAYLKALGSLPELCTAESKTAASILLLPQKGLTDVTEDKLS